MNVSLQDPVSRLTFKGTFMVPKASLLLFLVVWLCATVAAAAETERATKTPTQKATPSIPLPFPVTIAENESQTETRALADQLTRKHDDEDLLAQQSMASSARVQAYATLAATFFSALAAIFVWFTLRETRRTTDAAIREAMPYLIPEIPGCSLHPLKDSFSQDERHLPSVKVRFKNVGRTPAEIRYAKVRLELITNDELPGVPPDLTWEKQVESSAVIAPDHSGGTRVWKFTREITPYEMSALAKDHAEGQSILRFYVVGVVVYDDVFNTRHTHYFCVKIRHGFEAMRGGRRYNRVDRTRAPTYKQDTEIHEESGE